MEQKKPISHIVAGLVISGLLIVLSLIMSVFMGSTSKPGSGWMTWLIVIGGLVFFINQYGKAKNNNATFGELFSYGFKTTALMTLVFVLFLVILIYAYPEMKEKAMQAAREQLENQKGINESDIDRNMGIMEKYFGAIMIGGMVLGFSIMGAIGSLIGASVTKKEKTNPIRNIDHLDQPQS